MEFNNINYLYHWQRLLFQAQALAASLPDMRLTPLLPLDELVGILAFLKRSYAEKVV